MSVFICALDALYLQLLLLTISLPLHMCPGHFAYASLTITLPLHTCTGHFTFASHQHWMPQSVFLLAVVLSSHAFTMSAPLYTIVCANKCGSVIKISPSKA
ncbi:hypothetical protein EDC04DRAFT_2647655 [Pisolithus marmoratus]|nr:hypothetical protein EDC04DRAFT_2647655 [Pisolithus marmoratus]